MGTACTVQEVVGVFEVQEVHTCMLAPSPPGLLATATSPGRPASHGPAAARLASESGGQEHVTQPRS